MEVSGVVRLIYRSLGVKGLNKQPVHKHVVLLTVIEHAINLKKKHSNNNNLFNKNQTGIHTTYPLVHKI